MACSAAAADDIRGGAWAADRAPAAALYLEFPLTAGHRTPMLGFRVQRAGATGLEAMRGDRRRESSVALDVRLNARKDRDADTAALSLLGRGAIIGIVAGAVVGLAVIADDDDGDGGGY